MRSAEQFDTFYVATRHDLWETILATTGDRDRAAQAVESAYRAAWRRWNTVGALEDPFAWVVERARAATPTGPLTTDATTSTTSPARGRMPRGSILRRAEDHRQRTLTVASLMGALVLGVVAALVLPRLGGSPPASPDAASPGATNGSSGSSVGATALTADLSSDDLLDEDQIRRLAPQEAWRAGRPRDLVDTGSEAAVGSGRLEPCRHGALADPSAQPALARAFRASGRSRMVADQRVEASASSRAARTAYATMVSWYASCATPRVQLLTTYRVDDLADNAVLMVLRSWERPVRTFTVAVARTGRITTSTVVSAPGDVAAPALSVQSLADSVAMLCELNGTATGTANCAFRPSLTRTPPPRSDELGMLATVDLPRAGNVDQPWVATSVARSRPNPAATICDQGSFAAGGVREVRSRSLVIPGAGLPATFGLAETHGRLPSRKAASRLAASVREQVRRCEDRFPTATVRNERNASLPGGGGGYFTWQVSAQVSRGQSFAFSSALVRAADRVAQVTFSPAPGATLTRSQLRDVVVRAGVRLRELPPPLGRRLPR